MSKTAGETLFLGVDRSVLEEISMHTGKLSKEYSASSPVWGDIIYSVEDPHKNGRGKANSLSLR